MERLKFLPKVMWQENVQKTKKQICPTTFKIKEKHLKKKFGHSYSLWIVENKCDTDDEVALVLVEHGLAERSAKLAWKHFLKLCGGEREIWKKRGYRARQIEVFVRFKSK